MKNRNKFVAFLANSRRATFRSGVHQPRSSGWDTGRSGNRAARAQAFKALLALMA